MIRHLQREFEPQRLLPSVIAGLTSGVSSVTWAISCQVFPDLDRGVEWCANQLLQTDVSQLAARRSLDEPLEPQFDNFVQQLMQYLQPLELQIGEYLFHQGDPFDGLYFVESGRVSVVLT